MQWPKDLIALLARGMDVEPIEGLTQEHVYQTFLDETARRAVWRAGGKPARIRPALETPYTPIGSITTDFINGLARRLCLHGPLWGEAVHAIHDFMAKHAEEICVNFKDEAQPYHCDIGF